MKVIRTTEKMKAQVDSLKKQNKTIGFVPTMGYLHDGHLSLVKEARKENDIVIMSIFVNPLQFGPNEDFDRYPRNEEQDCQLAKESGVDIIFMPTVDEIYPEEMAIQMTVTKGTDVLCGRTRPGHFDGVVTVLTKLFHLIQPTSAYFGLKDAQQFAVVKNLVTQFNFPISLVGLPTVREEDGLAKSSRNVYLTDSERKEASILHKSLTYAQKLIVDGFDNPATISMKVKKYIETNSSGRIDYVDLLSYPNLNTIDKLTDQMIIAVAVQFDKARLIDNMIVTKDGKQVNRID